MPRLGRQDLPGWDLPAQAWGAGRRRSGCVRLGTGPGRRDSGSARPGALARGLSSSRPVAVSHDPDLPVVGHPGQPHGSPPPRAAPGDSSGLGGGVAYTSKIWSSLFASLLFFPRNPSVLYQCNELIGTPCIGMTSSPKERGQLARKRYHREPREASCAAARVQEEKRSSGNRFLSSLAKREFRPQQGDKGWETRCGGAGGPWGDTNDVMMVINFPSLVWS